MRRAEVPPKVLLWDLDGTLVRWSSNWRVISGVAWRFLRGYARSHGFLRTLVALAPAYGKMLRQSGHGARLNRVFLDDLGRRLRVDPDELEQEALEIVERDLAYLEHEIYPIAAAMHAFDRLASSGRYRMVAATNPTMPQRFNELRLGWAGYDPGRFELITGTEVCVSVKHRPGYYQGLLEVLQVDAADCLMIGNDAKKDLPAALVGIPVFLLTAGHESLEGAPPGAEPVATGGYPALHEYLEEDA